MLTGAPKTRSVQKNETPRSKLTEENIRQLEDAGFKWSLSTSRTFDELFAQMKYKEKVGHCNATRTKSGDYPSLGQWGTNNLRTSYKQIQKRETPHHKVTEGRIRQLEDADFTWSLRSQST